MEAKIDNLVRLIEGMSVRLTAVEERTMLGTSNVQQTQRPTSYADAVRSHNTHARHHNYNTHTYRHNNHNSTHTNTHSRGPRHFTNSNRQGNRGHQYNIRPQPSNYTQPRSNNTQNNNIPNMDLAKLLQKAVQLRSHERLWQSCPTKVSEQVNGFINSITPPLPTMEFIQELQSLETHITNQTKTIVQDHLKSALNKVRQSLADSDPEQLETATSLARQQLIKFQGKIPAFLRDQWLREESWLVGTGVHVIDKEGPRTRSSERTAPVAMETTAPAVTSETRPKSPAATPLRPLKRSINSITRSPEGNDIDNDININNTCIMTSNRFEVLNSLSVTESPRKQRITRRSLTQSYNNNNYNLRSISQPTVQFSEDSSDAEPNLSEVIEEVISSSNPGSPTAAVTRSGYIKLHETASTSANNWELKVHSQAPVVIVADSNMKLIKQIPENFELHVFPGCRLEHVDRMLRTATLKPETQHILVAVGINNRSEAANRIPSKLATVIDVIKGLNRICHFLGVSYNDLPDHHADNMDLLNSVAKSKLQDSFIEPLQKEQVKTKYTHDIHYNITTVDKILSSIINHFLL